MSPDPNAKLFEIDTGIFFRLADELSRNESWKRVIEAFPEVLDQQQRNYLSMQTNPGLQLLNELGERLYEVRHLKILLRQCALHDALSLISQTEPLLVLKQPTDVLKGREKLWIRNGDVLELEFLVIGVPKAVFAWFRDGNLLEGQSETRLRLVDFTSDLEGIYICRATQNIRNETYEVFSEPITVENLPEIPKILEQPPAQLYISQGSPILLHIRVSSEQKTTFQWVRDNEVLENETENVFFVSEASDQHSGHYKCYVSNKHHEIIIETTVTVYETTVAFEGPVTEKIALLISNSSYNNLETLKTPTNDVVELALILQDLGFKTICLSDLKLSELEVAVNLLANLTRRSCFAVFYYAGHGFDCGEPYLLPVDCPGARKYLRRDAFPESRLLGSVLEKEPALFVVMLDMCLHIPDKAENTDIYNEASDFYAYKSDRNLIRAYSTTVHRGAYEHEDGVNSVYVSCLKRHLKKKLPILSIFGKVNKDITELCPKQMPTISYNTAHDFYLHQETTEDTAQNLYKKLQIEETAIAFDKFEVVLRKYSNVFNNIAEIEIPESKPSISFRSDNCIIQSKPKTNSHLLIIENLQRLPDLKLKLQINDVIKEISLPATYKLHKFFKDI